MASRNTFSITPTEYNAGTCNTLTVVGTNAYFPSTHFVNCMCLSYLHAIVQLLTLFQEIMKKLKSLGFEWKIINPYYIRCRYKLQSNSDMKIKLDLQLYQLDQRNFLLDFKVYTIQCINLTISSGV